MVELLPIKSKLERMLFMQKLNNMSSNIVTETHFLHLHTG